LALRVYGYNHELALARLIEPDSLPFQLRVLIKDTALLQAAAPSKRGVLRLDDVYQGNLICLEKNNSPFLESDLDSDQEEGGEAKTVDNDDIVALLTATVPTTSRKIEPVLSVKELRMKKTEERLRKLLEKSSDAMDLIQVQYLVEKINEDKERKAEKVINVGGQKYTKLYKDT
jgi:hypothetical protein